MYVCVYMCMEKDRERERMRVITRNWLVQLRSLASPKICKAGSRLKTQFESKGSLL